MKFVRVGHNGEVVISLGAEDIRMFQSAIRETLEAIPDWEFSTRVGFDRAELSTMFDLLSEIKNKSSS